MRDNIPAEATPTGAHAAPGSLEAAAAAFRGILAPKGTTKRPGESKPPKPEATPEPEVDETETEQPEEEATDETTDETEAPAEETPADEPASDDEAVETEETTDEETDATPETKSRKLKFSDGTEEEVSEDEAYNGYLRTKDYTRKTQQAAEARKKAEAAEAAWSERAAQMAANLEQVKAAMTRMVPQKPNFAELRKKLSPEDYANAVEDWTAFESEQKRVDEDIKKLAEQRAQKYQSDFEKWRKQEFDLLMAAIPEWVDPKVGEREGSEMAAYALANGFSEEEVNTAVDHRYLLLFRKAMLWDRAQKNAGKVKPKIKPKGSIKTAPPGGKQPAPQKKTDEKRAQDSLRQSGSLEAAASVFSHIIRRPRR